MADTNKDIKEDKPEEKKLVIDPSHTFSFYCRPGNFTKVISNLKLVYASWALLGYIIQFLLIITVINIYSDNDRLLACGGKPQGEEASKVYDIALILLASYHLIEWFRFVIFLVAVFLGVNLISLYYILYLNTIFGMAAYFVAHAKRFNETGKQCADI